MIKRLVSLSLLLQINAVGAQATPGLSILDGELSSEPKSAQADAMADWIAACQKWMEGVRATLPPGTFAIVQCGRPTCEPSNDRFICVSQTQVKFAAANTNGEAK